ncbi:MAG: hypothetical protein MHM6MM_005824 [Cercozoa sp. M6MM]
MVRFQAKGGVWTNAEDESLKALIMKYGLNQWARISSLLPRKSAKQCKARWYEWLSPHIKKTEWTREEEERLLYMCKIMPCQWRTIAKAVGRTAHQCVEHYETLIKRASADLPDAGEGDAEDALAAGDYVHDVESKPARPDAMDMDEDFQEMLSEARARLANRKGKKAHRKARAAMMEKARVTAMLQKRRELVAAGLGNALRKHAPMQRTRKGHTDFNADIPFERKVPRGFYDTTQELARERDESRARRFAATSVSELEGESRASREAKERKQDRRRQQLLKQIDLPKHIARVNALTDAAAGARAPGAAPKLNLPAPQVADGELDDIASMSKKVRDQQQAALKSGSEATQFLVADYSAAATPSAAAAVLATALQTPLATFADGKDARSASIADALAIHRGETPALDVSKSVSQLLQEQATPAQTPSLLALQTPALRTRNAIDINIDAMDSATVVEELRRENERLQREKEQARTMVIKRELPRPRHVNFALLDAEVQQALPAPVEVADEEYESAAVSLLLNEMLALAAQDAKCFPQGKKKALPEPTPLLSQQQLRAATSLLIAEVQRLRAEDKDVVDPRRVSPQELAHFAELWHQVQHQVGFDGERFVAAQDQQQELQLLQQEFALVEQRVQRLESRAAKQRAKVQVFTKGLQTRLAGTAVCTTLAAQVHVLHL